MTMVAPKPMKKKRPTSLKPKRSQAGFAFLVLLIVNILNYADRYVLSAVLPGIKHDFNMTNFQGGLLISSFLVVYAIATLPLGVWADRGIRKNIIALCVGIWSVATALAGFTQNLLQLFFMRSILGIGEAGYAPASLSLLGDFFSKAKRGRVLSYWSIGTLIGAAIGVALGGRVADTLGWRWAFYIVGIPGLIAAFLAWRIHEPRRGAFENETEDIDEIDSNQEHGKIGKDFWGTAQKLLGIPTYLVLMQRRRPEGRLLTCMLGFLLGAPMVLLALSIHTLPLFIAVFIVACISLNFCTGPLNAVIQDVVAPNMRATAIGLALLLAHLLGDAAAPTIVGLISDNTSLGTALQLTAPLFLFLAGLACLLGLKTVARDMQRMQQQIQKQKIAS